jgi:hypothetical protein
MKEIFRYTSSLGLLQRKRENVTVLRLVYPAVCDTHQFMSRPWALSLDFVQVGWLLSSRTFYGA